MYTQFCPKYWQGNLVLHNILNESETSGQSTGGLTYDTVNEYRGIDKVCPAEWKSQL